MRENYANLNADYGFGHAKQELFELIIDKFKIEREKYNYYMNNVQENRSRIISRSRKSGYNCQYSFKKSARKTRI
jgi:tryptophanyl-tRNA synthetase